MLSGLLSVETTVCLTNVVSQVTGQFSLNNLVSIDFYTNVSLDSLENFRNGKMDFLVKYSIQDLGKSILEKYLPFAQDTFKKYLEDTKITYYKKVS